MTLRIPEFCLVALVGVSGSGKSTFARRHFAPTEVLCSDTFRGMVSDDENDQAATGDAFDALYYVARKRLEKRKLTVIDATNLQRPDRARVLALAREYHCLSAAIVLDIDQNLCAERNEARPDRDFGAHVLRRQSSQLRRSLRGLRKEGFRFVFVVKTPEEADSAEIERQRLWTDRRDETGPFDLIGDVHGCFDELLALLDKLGWSVEATDGGEGEAGFRLKPPEAGRKLVFLGDLVDRGPNTPGVLRLAMDAVEAGQALCVPGNHDVKLLKALDGRRVKVAHGLDLSLEQLGTESDAFRQRVREFLRGLISHYELDGGRLVVAHAGMRADMQGRASGAVRAFALYGETTGETDEFGLPVRYDWAREYRGRSVVVYGHTPVPEPEWLNNTINLDTGCVFGGALTALRYPERELVSVPAAWVYAEPARPLDIDAGGRRAAQHKHDDLLDLADVLGKQHVITRFRRTVTIREDEAAAALEVMSRFAVDPKWLIHLPPTMSPTETSSREGFLEYPEEAFAYYRSQGIEEVVCQAKHMGSRALLVVCRSERAARERFGIDPGLDPAGGLGVCVTRTGRPFFSEDRLTAGLLARLREASDAAGLWDELASDWLCFDAELMPWSAKAQKLLRRQYAPVGSAAEAALASAEHLLRQSSAGAEFADDFVARQKSIAAYRDAYRHYCWPVAGLGDLRLAPFHLLASEGRVHHDRDHLWHLETVGKLADHDKLFQRTEHRIVQTNDASSCEEATAWWLEMTSSGGEGMVVKPLKFLAHGRRGLVQPALKCRGREYLRIIYGPEYTDSRNLERLRQRHLGKKRSLALRELALGLEALERFVAREPLRRVHQCVFGVLALETEPVDPRL